MIPFCLILDAEVIDEWKSNHPSATPRHLDRAFKGFIN